jgi:hypothetical protein
MNEPTPPADVEPYDDGWRINLEADSDWQDGNLYFQIDGNDVMSITDIDTETGDAIVIVHASTHPNATTLFTGHINIKAHIGLPKED